MEITNNKFNTLPEQVQENKDNIKTIAEYIKPVYNARTTLAPTVTGIGAELVTDWVDGTENAFILDRAGNVFKVLGQNYTTIVVAWWCTLPQGAQGATGAQGPQGPQGARGVGFDNTTDINLVVGDPLSVTYDTEDGITITSQGGIEADGQTFTPTVETNVPLIAGNGLTMDATEDGKHVDVHLSAETQSTLARALKMPTSAVHETKIVAIDDTNAQTMLAIGAGLSVENGALKASGGGYTKTQYTSRQTLYEAIQSATSLGKKCSIQVKFRYNRTLQIRSRLEFDTATSTWTNTVPDSSQNTILSQNSILFANYGWQYGQAYKFTVADGLEFSVSTTSASFSRRTMTYTNQNTIRIETFGSYDMSTSMSSDEVYLIVYD